ncbi:MAG: prepilin-type N-terminal cleavage/methylation domain-containing protein [Planctomycetales bacterium]|nr:prepilin-type N-terminal cleavage/methylation domain-containing protein [Planctomycetales bacterium]
MHHSRRGLTFLEVTVVVLIIGVLAAVGTPHFARSVRTRNARNAAIRLADYVNYVRSVAINEGRSTQLSVDGATDRFTSPDVDFPDQPGKRISLSIKEDFDVALELSASFDSASTLTFDLEGGASVAGNPLGVGVISVGSRDIVFQILVDSNQGVVSITETAATPVSNPSDSGNGSIDAGGV